MADGDLLTLTEAADVLGISVRHVRRLAEAGSLAKVARGIVDRASVDRYLMSQRQGRTRAWAEHTGWGATALLAGRDASWLGATQTSRLRHTLRRMTDPADLLVRMRDRARIETYAAHRAALPRLQATLAIADPGRLGIVETPDGRVDGYIDANSLDATVQALGLRPDSFGNAVLRVTSLDPDRVADLVTTTSVVVALDAATALDPRVRGVGHAALTEILKGFR